MRDETRLTSERSPERTESPAAAFLGELYSAAVKRQAEESSKPLELRILQAELMLRETENPENVTWLERREYAVEQLKEARTAVTRSHAVVSANSLISFSAARKRGPACGKGSTGARTRTR